MFDHELVADPVQLIGRDTGRDRGCGGLHRLRRDATSDPHLLDGGVVLDLGPVYLAGAGRSTYSGRGMGEGTERRPLIAPGATLA